MPANVLHSEPFILHFGNLAGWPYKIAENMRAHGVNAINTVYAQKESHETLDRGYEFDEYIFEVSDSLFTKAYKLHNYLKDICKKCRLVHYHSSNIFPRELHWAYEGRLLADHKIPMLITFGGGDIRSIKKAKGLNPNFPHMSAIKSFYREMRRQVRLKSWHKHLKYAAVDPEFYDELKPYFEKLYFFRQPVDTKIIEFCPPSVTQKIPTILHIPTEPLIKGTRYVVDAVNRLNSEGYKFKFVSKTNLTHADMMKEIQKADIYVDDLCIGAHGQTPVETMCAGKPTLTHIRKDLICAYPRSLPLVNTSPNSIYDDLKKLILSPGLRHDIGEKGREYAEKYHDLNKVSDNLLEIYEEIGIKRF